MIEDVPLLEFMCLVSACMQGESYWRWLRSLLCLCDLSWVLITFLVCWFTSRRLAHTTVPGNTLFRETVNTNPVWELWWSIYSCVLNSDTAVYNHKSCKYITAWPEQKATLIVAMGQGPVFRTHLVKHTQKSPFTSNLQNASFHKSAKMWEFILLTLCANITLNSNSQNTWHQDSPVSPGCPLPPPSPSPHPKTSLDKIERDSSLTVRYTVATKWIYLRMPPSVQF